MAGPLFTLGQVVATPGALAVMSPEEPLRLLVRHQSGDWGEVPPGDAQENEYGLKHGFSEHQRGRGRHTRPCMFHAGVKL